MKIQKKLKKVEKTTKISQKPLVTPVSPSIPETHKLGVGVKHVFENLKKHFEPTKVDEFQAKWLALPENRKKYEKITDAPQVAVEEVIAMTNDLIQYIQGQTGGNSGFLKKIKAGLSTFFKNPAKFVQEKAEAGKEMAVEMKDSAQGKIKEVTSNLKDKTEEKVDDVKKKTKISIKKTENKSIIKVKSKTSKVKLKPKKEIRKPIKK